MRAGGYRAGRITRPAVGALYARIGGVVLAGTLAGCAVHPRPAATHIDRHIDLQAVLRHPRRTRGARVRWGGLVVQDRVGRAHSTLTVLAYPLNSRGRPRLRRMPEGRFQAVAPGYLDPMLFARGRPITVAGVVTGTRRGLIGKARYVYPRIRILATHVWRLDRPWRRRWHVGLGIAVGL
ncbi:Slp family lipoprotein [Acidiferrobacter sp.]|uniref:Slp family lipoprotein n=1 Tax=Acidiferrobacter sp. TaxID=1872107 RepID=UPI00262EB506|nr:Slp family lipoprotein [Acidiferrobacter sp.]